MSKYIEEFEMGTEEMGTEEMDREEKMNEKFKEAERWKN